MKRGFAYAVDRLLQLISIQRQKHVQESVQQSTDIKTVKIKSIRYIGKEDVYNMEVKSHHNFSVNGGFIVHNCMDAIRYFVYTVLRFKVEEYDDSIYQKGKGVVNKKAVYPYGRQGQNIF
nr:hypothetical protein [Clostridium butyricum]